MRGDCEPTSSGNGGAPVGVQERVVARQGSRNEHNEQQMIERFK